MIHNKYYVEKEKYDRLVARKNQKSSYYNGLIDRYEYPVLTREHAPVHWRYDINADTNPYFMERLGINAVMNSGAIWLDGKYYLVVRVEGNDRKSFFAVAESGNGIDGFHFWDYPVVLPDTCPEETNVYDMRLTKHEDGYIYGVFCSESKDTESTDLSAAVAQAGIVRTKDLKTWERLDNLKTLESPQQRNVLLHPEFVNGKYAFYTRPMDGFIETGSGGGIGFGLCDDICHAVIDKEKIISHRVYHTITESKNGAGAVPIKGNKCWINIAHGVRNTAAGLRYVLYVFGTDLNDPSKVIAEPSGVFLVPLGRERTGDVSNVVFTNGAIARDNGDVYIYYAVAWGNPERLFSLAIVNQRVNYGRDEKLAEEFSISSGIKTRNILVDSDYLLSYGDVELEDVAVKESLFEKFFLSWRAGALDAVIMPESFFDYCIGKDGEFTGLLEICPDLLDMGSEDCFYKYNDVYTGIYIDKTKLSGDFITDGSGPVILVFIKNGSHLKECRKFIEYVLGD